MHKIILKVNNISKIVKIEDKETVILQNVNFEVLAGESVAIVGASGSGKSTLLGIIATLDEPTTGEVILANVKTNNLTEDEKAEIRAKNIGFVFQNFQLIPQLTALENVMLSLEIKGEKDVLKIATKTLAEVGLEHRLNSYPKQLSGGEQQRVAIARAFALNPNILFLDEPTGNLDSKTGDNISNLLFDLNKSINTTLVLVTHDIKLANRCQRILSLDSGVLDEKHI